MKPFVVTVTAPAYADVIVEAASEKEAIDMVQDMIDAEDPIRFEVDIEDADEAEYYARPAAQNCERKSADPELKDYTVVLEVTGRKEVPVKAINEDAACELVKEMFEKTDQLDLTDEDIVSVDVSVKNPKADRIMASIDEVLDLIEKLIEVETAPEDEIECTLILPRG